MIFPHFNDWLDTESDGFPRVRAGKALDWVDNCVHSGRKVPQHTLFALLFGQYLEERAAALRDTGVHPLPALEQAVAEFLAGTTPRVQVPRKVMLSVRDILWSQHRFEKREGKKPLYFLRRQEFPDAFEYLQFNEWVTGENAELVSWWKKLAKEHPPEPREKPAGAKVRGKERGRPQRRRRRGPRKPEGQRPKPEKHN